MISRLFRSFILRNLARNKLRTALTIIGIALGVAIFLAINLANQTALNSFRASVDRISGQTNLEIRPDIQATLDESILEDLRWLWLSDTRYTPVLEQTALIPGATKEMPGEVINVLGLDMLADFGFRTYEWEVSGEPQDTFRILEPGRAFIGNRLAARYSLNIGDPLPILVNDQAAELFVAGILAPKGLGEAYGGNLLVMDIDPAQQLFGLQGRLTRIDLITPKARLPHIQAKLSADLPPQLVAQRPARRGNQVEKMLSAYQYNLTMLSFISLLVGTFLIYNTMSISIIRRRPEIGTLRALGVQRREILRLFLAEALSLGVIGTVLGIILGLLMAGSAVQAVSATVEALYTGQAVTGIHYDPWRLLLAFVFGIGITVLGGLAPVWEAAHISPAEASRRGSYEDKAKRYVWPMAGIGTVMLAGAGWASLQPPIGDLPLFGFVAALLIILGSALWTPALLLGAFSLLLPVLKALFNSEGRLGGISLRGALGRTSVAVASLMIGIAMMVSLAIMIGSFRETVITWVNQTLRADLWIEPAARQTNKQTATLNPAIVEKIRLIPGIAAVDTFLERQIIYNDHPTNLGVGNLEVLAERGNLIFMNNEPAEAVIARTFEHPAVIVTESFARKNAVQQGDTLKLATPDGPQAFIVEGVYYDYASDLGYIIIPRRWYEYYYHDPSVAALALYLSPGASDEAIRQEIYRAISPDTRLSIQTNQELRHEVLTIFDRTFAITYALHLIAIAVALLAVMNSLFAVILESRREYGILKYIGASRRQIEKMVLVQAGLLGLFGNLLGLAVGFMLSFLLIYVINRQSFGWTIQYLIPTAFILQSFALVMATAIAAGVIPARMAARTLAPEVVRAE